MGYSLGRPKMGIELEAELFKKYSSDMIAAIRYPVNIAGKLYSSGIIDGSTRDRVQKSDNGANDLIIAVETFILSQPVLGKRSGMSKKFKEILEIFKEFIPLNYIVKALEDEHEQVIGSNEENDNNAVETTPLKKYKADLMTDESMTSEDTQRCEMDHNDSLSDPHIKPLAETLQVYSKDLISGVETEAVYTLMKTHIEAHIKNKLKENYLKEAVQKHLTDLIMNALIPSDIVDWCYETLNKVYADLDASVSSGSGEDDCSANRELPPIFSKDTVYHASLCLLALSHHPSQSSSILSNCGHSFDSISFSITNQYKMMIALQGDIVYISFDDDLVEYLGFIHEEIPLRYFCELLHQYKRLIFTGYSFGGYVAQEVLECLWEFPFFNRDVLLENTACIMFGTDIEDFYSRSNDVYFSSYLFLFELEISSVQVTSIFDDSELELCELNTFIIKVQNGNYNYEKLQMTRGGLFKIHGQFYDRRSAVHQWLEMKDYHLKIFRGYLEKEPDPYPVPPRQDMSSIQHVQSLIPSISNVELHQHKHPEGYELAVIINGDNLWFCRKFKVIIDDYDIDDIKFEITPECVTQKQISYNVSLKNMIAFQDTSVQVKVFSTFCKLPRKTYPTIYHVPDPISFRQSQLAKQTPSQIIQLSFLSALLEQSPSVQAGRPTKRFTSIIKFLQEAARIVPMESITSAIAGCDNRVTACKCAQAFLSAAYSSPIPVSRLMANGCQNALKMFSVGDPHHIIPYIRPIISIPEPPMRSTQPIHHDIGPFIPEPPMRSTQPIHHDIGPFIPEPPMRSTQPIHHDIGPFIPEPPMRSTQPIHHDIGPFIPEPPMRSTQPIHHDIGPFIPMRSTQPIHHDIGPFIPEPPMRSTQPIHHDIGPFIPEPPMRSTQPIHHDIAPFIPEPPMRSTQPIHHDIGPLPPMRSTQPIHHDIGPFIPEPPMRSTQPIHHDIGPLPPMRSTQPIHHDIGPFIPEPPMRSTQPIHHDIGPFIPEPPMRSTQPNYDTKPFIPHSFIGHIGSTIDENIRSKMKYTFKGYLASSDGNTNSSKKSSVIPSTSTVIVPLLLSNYTRKLLLHEFHPNIISSYFREFSKQLLSSVHLPNIPNLICGRNIGEAYPISKASYSCSALTPLPMILQKARHDLAIFSKISVDTNIGSRPKCNSDMLETVNNIVDNDLKPCVTMLGGFMEQQIRVPLVNNPLDTAKAIITAERSGAVGVWALFAMSFEDIARIPKSKKNQALVIQITEFIEGMFSKEIKKKDDDQKTTTYNAKLQFLLQGMRSTVTCSSHYISYSLERELLGICEERSINTSTRIDTIVNSWNNTFKSTALTLVPHQYRPLLARWLIWALNIHQLRESLASYTTVGVIGLVNSGKSTLVNKVFKIKTIQGDTQSARTTVPLIYNLDNEVEGLSVIDFPGVDDRDDSIGGLAKLLVGLAQIVIFVCEYKRFHTKSAEEWMEIFHKDFDSSPILVCITNADRLYEDQCDDDMIPTCPEGKVFSFKMQFEKELKATIGSTKIPRNCDVRFCSLIQGKRSQLNNEEGRQSMRKVGIFTPQDIGGWIKRALEVNIQQKNLADKLGRFLAEQK